MSPTETNAYHAHGNTAQDFALNLENAMDYCQDDGYEVVGISHAVAALATDHYDAAIYSAVIWGQRELVTEEEDPS